MRSFSGELSAYIKLPEAWGRALTLSLPFNCESLLGPISGYLNPM